MFAFVTMVSFDVITGWLGIWTLVTATTYAGLSILFYFAFQKLKKVKLRHYLLSGVWGVLIFDFITGPIMSSMLWNMSFEMSLLGQIPFTIFHLATVTGFVLVLTPLLDRIVIENPSLEDAQVKRFIFTRFIMRV